MELRGKKVILRAVEREDLEMLIINPVCQPQCHFQKNLYL